MGDFPDFFSSSLVFEKCLQPKNPRWAERGEGCTACSTWWCFWKQIENHAMTAKQEKPLLTFERLGRTLLMADPFFWAYAPQSKKTRPCRLLLSHWTTASVKTSQPLSLWELAWCARTVSTAFSKSTPGEKGQRKDGQQVCGWPNLQHCIETF